MEGWRAAMRAVAAVSLLVAAAVYGAAADPRPPPPPEKGTTVWRATAAALQRSWQSVRSILRIPTFRIIVAQARRLRRLPCNGALARRSRSLHRRAMP